MLAIAICGLVIFALLGGLRLFERASVHSIKLLLAWIAALAGLSLAVLLVLTGREGAAIGAATLIGPLVLEKWRASPIGASFNARARAAGEARSSTGPMSQAEAYAILGLAPGASATAIRDAHRRLMRGAHPDGGGSDWLASRINQARDTLLGRRR